LGIEVRSHSSAITEDQKEKVLKTLIKIKRTSMSKGVAEKKSIIKVVSKIKAVSKKIKKVLKPVTTKKPEIVDKKEEKYIKKAEDTLKRRPGWDEEKKINVRTVLDKELDKEEREGKLKSKAKSVSFKKREDKAVEEKHVAQDSLKDLDLKDKISKRPEIKKNIELQEGVNIKLLSERIGIPSSEIIQTLFNMGEIVHINQSLDKDFIELLANEYNFKYSIIDFEDQSDEVFKDLDKDLVVRPPIVTVMGHVDHGKTTLLDAIRQSNVVSGEAGGITQKIGAYQTFYNERKITFIDTPGHEAFTSMRARGARVTDIAVIVIAADDGVMPQTVEAIDHAKAAGVPIIVVVNKIDLPNSNPDKIKQGLTEYNLVPEEWGGDTIFVNLSAKNRVNINELLEMILLVADLHELKGNPSAEGNGIIIESKLDKGFGPVGTVLIRRGTIRVGDFFVTGNSYGKIRSIHDEYRNLIDKGELSQPVEISGFSSVPQAGDKFFIVKSEKVAKYMVGKREYQKKLARISEARKHITLEDLAEIPKENEIKKLKIILKSESNGSLDAVEKSLKDAEEENIKIEIIHKGVGAITDSDILLAAASDAIIIGFGVVAMSKARVLAKEEGVDIRTYEIIYKLIDEIKLAFKGMLEPKFEDHLKGTVEIREMFKIPKVGNVAGCYIADGEVERGNLVRVIRDGSIIFNSKIASLHRFKEDVKKVATGYECGVRVENYQDLNKGDILEVYEKREV
ncbi:MAG: translation initiation factor IF-2, partial [Candidatus Atribacteria bacterium]|nr:translation initiation factor IF-2 [Candidatus Atribacteria bacterium]